MMKMQLPQLRFPPCLARLVPLPGTLVMGAALSLVLLAACSAPPVTLPSGGTTDTEPQAPAKGDVLGQNSRLVIYQPRSGDTFQSIAQRFLGDARKDWVIADFNGLTQPMAGRPLVVPLRPLNPVGVHPDQYQSVPILCYHRFGPGTGKMTVSASNFATQLEWLARNDFRVIRLSQLIGYLQGREALPRRSVVITIDDGYETVHRYAFPLLKKHGFPATVFMYTDFIGARDALSWAQLEDMAASGLIDIQAHSKTHRNLIERQPGETEERYKQALESEIRVPREVLQRRLSGQVQHYAFPFGDANEAVLEMLARNGYELAVTVNPGGNPFFAQPLMLRRTMIYGDHDLAAFQAKLQISRALTIP
jgi:peptidoglycan/xylan/chitin deacetylase (PgdA/CDA1 family)